MFDRDAGCRLVIAIRWKLDPFHHAWVTQSNWLPSQETHNSSWYQIRQSDADPRWPDKVGWFWVRGTAYQREKEEKVKGGDHLLDGTRDYQEQLDTRCIHWESRCLESWYYDAWIGEWKTSIPWWDDRYSVFQHLNSFSASHRWISLVLTHARLFAIMPHKGSSFTA